MKDIADKWQIVRCPNGVGVWELTYDGEWTGDTFDTREEAKLAIENYEKGEQIMKDYAKVKEYIRKRINGNIIRKDLLIEKVENRFGEDAAVYAEKYLDLYMGLPT